MWHQGQRTQAAQADLFYQFQVAEIKQEMEKQRIQIQVAEAWPAGGSTGARGTHWEEELEVEVWKPWEAYRLACLGWAEKPLLVVQEEAEAQSMQMHKEARAFATGARAWAEAEQMAKKA